MSIRGTSRYHSLPVSLGPDQQQYAPPQPNYAAGAGSPGLDYAAQFGAPAAPVGGPQGYSVNPSAAFPYGNSNYQPAEAAPTFPNWNFNNAANNFFAEQDGFLAKAHNYSDKIDTSLSMAGLPMMEDKDRSKYFMLAGRVLMIFLFLAYIATEHITFLGLFVVLIGLTACVLVAIGYKARLSAAILILILSYRNLTTNQYWAFGYDNPVRDFLRYEHFQILSIIGGLLLVVNTGAGALSIDEKKKIY
ncbi:hypothetical protein D0Z00_003016 [Geotrichum galactomycetum]|uniref:Uncharacterized protein n=1 Tax=Geotrichum galactomycetum TaxID=27317 RepID=A0ACB6V2J0_9ASCO|nr:hypothetical protein D0Z00_003016 [Geotrichum candidum]